MNKIQISKRERVLFCICLGVIGCFLFYLGIKHSILTNWSKLSQEVALKEMKLQKCLKIMAQKEVIEKKYKKYVDKDTGSEEAEIAIVLKEVEKIANHNKVKTTNMKAKPVKDLDFYRKILISVECEATITPLAKFIYELQKSAQIIRVKSLRITTKGKYDTALQISLIVTKILIS